MDALLIPLLACALAEMGDRTQLLAMVLGLRGRGGDAAVLGGIALATLLGCALSAVAGWLLAPLLGTTARALFFALPFLFAGAGMLMRAKAPDDLANWRTGPFLTAFLAMVILQFGDKSQFLVAAVALRTGDPVLAALGGSIGILLALAPPMLLRQTFFTALPLALIRRGGGALFLLTGALLALGALGLL